MKKHSKVQWAPGQVSAKQQAKKNPPKTVWAQGQEPIKPYSSVYTIQECDKLKPGMLFQYTSDNMYIHTSSFPDARHFKYPVIAFSKKRWTDKHHTGTRSDIFTFIGMLEELFQLEEAWNPTPLKVPVFLWSRDAKLYSIPQWNHCLALL